MKAPFGIFQGYVGEILEIWHVSQIKTRPGRQRLPTIQLLLLFIPDALVYLWYVCICCIRMYFVYLYLSNLSYTNTYWHHVKHVQICKIEIDREDLHFVQKSWKNPSKITALIYDSPTQHPEISPTSTSRFALDDVIACGFVMAVTSMNVTKLQQVKQPCTNQKSRYKSTEPCMRIGIFAYTLSYSENLSRSLPPLFIIHLSHAALAKITN